jgi:hypothetical protein
MYSNTAIKAAIIVLVIAAARLPTRYISTNTMLKIVKSEMIRRLSKRLSF